MTRNPKKAAIDGALLDFCLWLIDTKDHYTSMEWEGQSYRVKTKSGKSYQVNKNGWSEK